MKNVDTYRSIMMFVVREKFKTQPDLVKGFTEEDFSNTFDAIIKAVGDGDPKIVGFVCAAIANFTKKEANGTKT